MHTSIELNVYGKIVIARQSFEGWNLRYRGADGKSRPAHDLIVPDFIREEELVGYLSDICHEWASEKFPTVYRIEKDG